MDGGIEWGGRPIPAWFLHLSKPELIPVRHAAKGRGSWGLGPESPFQILGLRSIKVLRHPAKHREGIKDDQPNAGITHLSLRRPETWKYLRREVTSATPRPQHWQIKGT